MAIEFAQDVFIPLGERGAEIFDDTKYWRDPAGRQLSSRLWNAKQADRDAIDRLLRESIARGSDPIQTAKLLEDYLTPVGRATTTRTPRSGTGNNAARRLARTETTRAFGQATLQAAELNPFVDGVKWSLSGRHSHSDVCDGNASRHSRGMGRGEYRTNDVPRYPGHPNCLCVLSPVTVKDDNAIIAQLRRDIGLEPEPSVRLIELPRRSGMWEKVVTLFRAARALIGKEAA